jgi:hypothetical protein
LCASSSFIAIQAALVARNLVAINRSGNIPTLLS